MPWNHNPQVPCSNQGCATRIQAARSDAGRFFLLRNCGRAPQFTHLRATFVGHGVTIRRRFFPAYTVRPYSEIAMQTPKCTVTRTHRLGVPLPHKELTERIPGPVRFDSGYHRGMRRSAQRLLIERGTPGTPASGKSPIPDLIDPVLLTYHSERAMMFRGWEEVDGRRYYQGWWIQWCGL